VSWSKEIEKTSIPGKVKKIKVKSNLIPPKNAKSKPLMELVLKLIALKRLGSY